MATLETYKFTISEFEETATNIKNIVISYLYESGEIDEETYNKYILNYAILTRKPSFFSRLWKRKKVLQDSQYIIIKQMSIREDKPDDDSQNKKPKLKVLTTKKDK